MPSTPASRLTSILAPLKPTPPALAVIVCLITVPLETGGCWLLLGHRLADVVMVYLLGVVIVAMRFGYWASLLTATFSVAAFDFVFTPPYFSFAVEDKRYVLTFLIMLFVAFVISNLTERIRHHAIEATHREVRTEKLYAMSRELSMAPSNSQIMEVACRHLRDAFASEVSVLLRDEHGRLYQAKTDPPRYTVEDDVVARAERMFAGISTGAPSANWLFSEAFCLVPLHASTGALGILVMRPDATRFTQDPENAQLLGAFASQIASAIERANLADEAQRAQLETQTERLRNALLSSVSHDLRNPLAVVKGAATALLDAPAELTSSRRREYLRTISDEASHLNRLVRNLLDMTSIEAGALRLHKDWHPLEEILGVALNRLDDQLENRAVEVNIPPEASLVPCDATLLEHVLVNLVENATKYTATGSAIEINAEVVEEGVMIEVADHGPGIPAGHETQVFDKFHRAARSATGMGLGLTICKGIISVHGGQIWCENRVAGGASFRFVLPRAKEGGPTMDGLPEVLGDS